MLNKKIKSGKKGQMFIVLMVISITIALTAAFFLLNYLYAQKSPSEFLGSYQSGIIDALSDGDKALVYTDQAAKIAVTKALTEYLYPDARQENTGDTDTSQDAYCGHYVYRLWNTIDKDCYPNAKEFNVLIDKYMANLTYLQSGLITTNYFDNILRQKIDYAYTYKNDIGGTVISGYPSNGYMINIFRDEKSKNDAGIQQYAAAKIDANGGEGDIVGIPFFSAASTNYGTGNSRKIKYIVIHYTAGSSIKAAKDRFQQPGEEASAHYVVGSKSDDFNIIQMVRDKDVAYHAGCTRAEYGCQKPEYKNINTDSIGIEIVNIGYDCNNANSCKNDAAQADCEANPYVIYGVQKMGPTCWQKYPPEQYDKVVALTAYLTKLYGIPIDKDHILGHVQIVQKNKVDPGPAFEMNSFITRVQTESQKDSGALNAEITSTETLQCPPANNNDWKISNVVPSSTDLTSDQTLTIPITISNDGDKCVSVKPEVTITDTTVLPDGEKKASATSLMTATGKSTSVYPKTDQAEFTNMDTITCRFTQYPGLATAQMTNKNCVLYYNADGSKKYYAIKVKATDNNGNFKEYTDKQITFSVAKGPTDSYNPGTTATQSTIPLTKAEQAKIQSTKTNLDRLGIKTYIEEIAQKEGVPKEIVFGMITQESGGIMKHNPGEAQGLVQMMPATFAGLKFDDKCTWDEYQNDAKCQIRAGIALLKQNYDAVKGKTLYYQCGVNCLGEKTVNGKVQKGYWSTCDTTCDMNKCIGPVNAQYTEWAAALRRYNGGGSITIPAGGTQTSGCENQPDYTYVDKVMKFAQGWGYVSSFSSVLRNEIQNGIYGTYTIKPTFSINSGFDFSIFENLTKFANETVSLCGEYKGNDKSRCVQDHIDTFNNGVSSRYINMNLSTNCDSGDAQENVNNFVESLTECALSDDKDCQCPLKVNGDMQVRVDGFEDYTKFTYNDPMSQNVNTKYSYAYIDYPVSDSSNNNNNNQLWNGYIGIKDIKIYKQNNILTLGSNNNNKYCTLSDNMFRLCLSTPYTYNMYDGTYFNENQKYDVNFAITLRDKIPPKQVTNIQVLNKKHSKNSVILTWDKNSENDVVKYVIYLSNDQNKFDRQTQFFKGDMKYRMLESTSQNYEEYASIEYDRPQCEQKSLNNVDYCAFKVKATDKNNQDLQIELQENKLYYMSTSNKFLYILSGTDSYNELSDGSEKFVGITAVDSNDNEIDGYTMDNKFESGKNLASITPQDSLEAGFEKITGYGFNNINREITLSWDNTQNYYIDGSPMTEQPTYKVYMNNVGSCPDNNIYAIQLLGAAIKSGAESGKGIKVIDAAQGPYCVGVTALGRNGKEFDGTFVKSAVIPAIIRP